MNAPSESPERILAGYRLGDHLGAGGQGRVYRAVRLSDQLEVAIKLYELPVAEISQNRARRRHQRESKALRGISSGSIVKIVEDGELSEPSIVRAGWLWTAFEYVEGRDLKHMMRLRPAEIPKIISALTALAQGLDLVHKSNVVHRDIKPDNIILRGKRWDQPVLVDFGYAKSIDASKLTRTGLLVGTQSYTAPEIQRGLEPTPFADQWSFARLSAELLLWARGEEFADLAEAPSVQNEIVERFADYPETAEVLQRALESDPDARFDDVIAFCTGLEEALYGDGLLERDESILGFQGQPWDKRRSLRSYLESIGFSDIREGASLWVYAGKKEFGPVRDYLMTKGVFFTWARTTKHPRPGWYTKNAK